MPFNKAIWRLIFAQGADGEVLLRVLDRFEAFGPNKYINEQLQAAIVKNPKVAEFDTAIKAVLLNWIIGTAHSIIQHGVNNGFDDDRDNDHNHDSNDDSGDGDNWRLVEYKHANLNKDSERREKQVSNHKGMATVLTKMKQ